MSMLIKCSVKLTYYCFLHAHFFFLFLKIPLYSCPRDRYSLLRTYPGESQLAAYNSSVIIAEANITDGTVLFPVADLHTTFTWVYASYQSHISITANLCGLKKGGGRGWGESSRQLSTMEESQKMLQRDFNQPTCLASYSSVVGMSAGRYVATRTVSQSCLRTNTLQRSNSDRTKSRTIEAVTAHHRTYISHIIFM